MSRGLVSGYFVAEYDSVVAGLKPSPFTRAGAVGTSSTYLELKLSLYENIVEFTVIAGSSRSVALEGFCLCRSTLWFDTLRLHPHFLHHTIVPRPYDISTWLPVLLLQLLESTSIRFSGYSIHIEE